MRHKVKGRKLNRDINERKALFKNLVRELILKERINTTEAKAKAIRPLVEKLVSKAKKSGQHERRQVLSILKKDACNKLFSEIGSRFKDKKSGFLKILKLKRRRGDDAPLVLIEWAKEETEKREIKEKPRKQK